MRRLTKSRFARTLASFLIVLFGGPSLIGGGLLLPAGAQITTQTQLQLVAIVPFQNLVKEQSEAFADQAVNAVAQALLDTQAYDVRPVEESKQKMADLSLRSPLDERALSRLGEAMGVGGVVFGEIRSAGVRKLTRSSQGEVVLMVGIYDLATGTIRNGTITTGRSSFAGGEVSPEKLVDEALNQAAYQAVKELQSNRPIIGIVQSSRNKEVSISVGGSAGVKQTMKFVVMRSGQRVGVFAADKIEQVFSDGHLVEGDARVGDKVVQIVELPERGKVLPVPGVKEQKKQDWSKLLLAVVAGALLLGSSKSSGTSGSTQGVVASAISNIIDTGLFTTQTSRWDVLGLFPLDPGGGGSGVQIRWSAPKKSSEIILGYELWIDGNFRWFTQGQGDAGRFITLPIGWANGFDVSVEIDPDSGLGRVTNNATISTVKFGVNDIPFSLASTYVAGDVHPTIIQYVLEPDIVQWAQKVPTGVGDQTIIVNFLFWLGPGGGEHHVYQIRQVTSRRYQDVSGNFFWEIIRETVPGRAVVATYVAPPILQTPLNNEVVADATAVTFAFNPPPGADDYIFQTSLDSQFSSNVTGVNNLTVLDGIHSSAELLVTTQDLTSMLRGSLPSGTTVYWRIGARWRGDTYMPLPYPKVGKNPTDTLRYVYSEARQLVTP